MFQQTPLKANASSGIDRMKEALNSISQDIWTHPELMFKEKRAHDILTSFLRTEGFDVQGHFVDETGFRATYGTDSDGPNVAMFCEFDALPDIGHACGHNLIAISGLAAAIGVKEAIMAAGKPIGMVTLFGSPAEEGGGGKIDFINASVLDKVDVAMMVHPANATSVTPSIFGVLNATYKFYGKAAHAAASPWEGRNALDAAVMAYQNVSCLRQQIKPTHRIHGVISNGGAKPNIIPEYTELRFQIRASTHPDLLELKEKVESCFESAAKATGCRLECEYFDNRYYRNVVHNIPLIKAFQKNAAGLGVQFDGGDNVNSELNGGSTDMGNVSHIVPSIHPFFNIGTDASLHTRAFQIAAGKEEAFDATIEQAKALAFTALDIYTTPKLFDEIKLAFREDPNIR